MPKVLHASGSGYFVDCITSTGNIALCPWSLINAMKTYWRVRSWQFNASGEITFDGITTPFSTSIPNITSMDVTNLFQRVPQTSESGLVCGNYFAYGYETEQDYWAQIEFYNPKKNKNLYTSGFIGFAFDYPNNIEYNFAPGLNSNFNISVLDASIRITASVMDSPEEVTQLSATLSPTLWWSYDGTYNTANGQAL